MATAVQVESILGGLTDNSGQPLAAGRVYTYSAGSTNPISLYTSADKSTSATNPLILDGHGKAQVWADGRYKFVVKDQYDVTQYTLDNLLYGFDDSTVLWGGQSTGSANVHTVTVPATVNVYSNGQRVSFIAGYTNSGATTLQLNALGAVSIVKGHNAISLQSGDIVAGQLVDCVYEAYSGTGRFRLESYPTVGDIQQSRFHVATNVGGQNAITADLAPAIPAYEAGLAIRFKSALSNSGPVTLNLNGKGAKTVQYNNAALVGGEIQANCWVKLVYDGAIFQLLNPYEVAITRWGGTTAGTATAYTISPAPAITAYVTGQRFSFRAHVANGAAATLAVNGLGAKTLLRQNTALAGNEFIANDIIEVEYNGTNFQIINLSSAPLFVDRTNNRVGIGTTSPSVAVDFGTSQANVGQIIDIYKSANVRTGIGMDSTTASMRLFGPTGDAPIIIGHVSTADGSTFTELLRVDASGNLGIGAPSIGSGSRLYVKSDINGYTGVTCDNQGQRTTFSSHFTAGLNQFGAIQATDINNVVNALALQPLGGTVLINKQFATTTGAGSYFTQAGYADYPSLLINCKTWSGNLLAIQNHYNGSYVGGMNYSDTGTSFPTASDYRLKENIVDLTDGLARLDKLKPRQYNFIIKPDETFDGFIAHEVQDLIPNAVEGDKDALNEDGTLKVQSLDYSKLVPLLTAALKELYAEVKTIKAALEK